MKFIVKNPRRLRAIPKLKAAKVGDYVDLDEKEARIHVRRGALMRARLPLKQYQKTQEIEEKQDVTETIEKPRRKKSSKKSHSSASAG